MDKNQSSTGRGRGRQSTTSSWDASLRTSPPDLTFRRPLRASGDGAGTSSGPIRIEYGGNESGRSSSPPHMTERDEEEGQEEIEPPVDHVREDGLRYIKPDESATGFIESHTAAAAIHDAIRVNYVEAWTVWREIPLEVRNRMFSEFKRKVYWLPRNEQRIRHAFEVRGAKRFSDIFHQIRLKNKRPQWMGEQIWECLQAHWGSEIFKKKQIQAKAARASEKGGMLNTCGSISLETHAARIEKNTGIRPSKTELFLLGHKKKNSETGARDQWVEARAEATYNVFQSLREEERLAQTRTEATDDSTARTQNPPRSDDELFAQAAGGLYKGRVYGMGNQPSTRRPTYSASSSTFVSQAQYEDMQRRMAELTENVNAEREETQQYKAQLKEQLEAQLKEQLAAQLKEQLEGQLKEQLEAQFEARSQEMQARYEGQSQQMMSMMQSLQTQVEKMKKRRKKKKKQSNEERAPSTDTDPD